MRKFIDEKFILPISTPQLPECRECCEYSFGNVGVNCAAPLHIQDICSKLKELHKCWILLFTCATTRCINLELDSGFHGDKLLLCLKRSIRRKRKPNLFVSDNFNTLKSKEIKTLILNRQFKWGFVLGGGFYERLINMIKNKK